MIGSKYNKLTVTGLAPSTITPKGRKIKKLICICDCGKEITVAVDHLKSGHTKSCGCYKEFKVKLPKTHGKTNTRTYESYHNMLRRCAEEGNKHYNGKGIFVCARWNPVVGGSFENFLEDMGECGENLSIDRVDNNGNYEPSNCRWATQSTQCFNKSFKPNMLNYRGVSLNKKSHKYIAYITCKGERYYLGSFSSFEDAKTARLAAEYKYFGDILK